MTHPDIENINKRLNIKLPDHYIQFITNYPDELIELKFNEEFLSNNPQYLISINLMLRSGEVPSRYFSIGNDIGGNYFFIDLNDENPLVYYLDHEETGDLDQTREFRHFLSPEHESLEELKEWLIETWGDALADLY